jgi:AcrR family transcriptional regulator
MSSRAAAGVLVPQGAGATRERILAAAELCLSRLGMAKFSMHDVATQAGLSRGAVYLHFSDRSALVDAVLTRAAERFVASSAVAIDRRRTLAAQVGEAAVFIREHLGDQILTLRLPADDETVFATLLTSRLDHVVEEWVEFWRPYLHDAAERGEVRPGIDLRQAGEWIVRLLLTFAVMPAVTFDADRPDQVRAFVRSFVVAGLGPRPSAREEPHR